MTKLTLQNCYHTVSVEVIEDDLNLDDLWRQLMEPLLLGAGYHQKTIERFLRDEPVEIEDAL